MCFPSMGVSIVMGGTPSNLWFIHVYTGKSHSNGWVSKNGDIPKMAMVKQKNIKMDGLVYTIKTYKNTLKWMMTGGTPMTWESSICAADLGHHLQHGVKVLRHEFRLGRRLWSGEILENKENGCI